MSWQNRILLVLALVASAALLPREEELGGEDLARVRDEAASLRAVNEALQSEICLLYTSDAADE